MKLSCALVLLFLMAPFSAAATTVQVTATDLNDAMGPGGDLWEFAYTVSGRAFAANEGFSVAFDPGLYSSLQALPAQPSVDWDVLVLQPDVGLPDAGFYDALALVNAPSLAVAFTVRAIWLGGALQPGPDQTFTVNQFASDGTFLGILEGGTVTVVPEPAAALLLLSAAVVITRSRRLY